MYFPILYSYTHTHTIAYTHAYLKCTHSDPTCSSCFVTDPSASITFSFEHIYYPYRYWQISVWTTHLNSSHSYQNYLIPSLCLEIKSIYSCAWWWTECCFPVLFPSVHSCIAYYYLELLKYYTLFIFFHCLFGLVQHVQNYLSFSFLFYIYLFLTLTG